MPARYLVRFDDICPTMNWDVWERVEELLDHHGVRPLVAVVPDNRDVKLRVGRENADFWNRARAWQEKGWAIGLHGYQHVYETADPGIVGVNAYSEFAGLARGRQEEKIDAALGIMAREGLRPVVWVAPAHSFDGVTLDVLASRGLRVVSDGLYTRPVLDAAWITWIPQQMWRFRRMPFGLWTVCCHHNNWRPDDCARFEEDLRLYRRDIVSVGDALRAGSVAERSVWDDVLSKVMLAAVRMRRRRRPATGSGVHGSH